MPPVVALKIDADTDRGTRLGVPQLLADCREFGPPACFLFSLGPDNTGKAIRRVFRPGFFKKVARTSVVQLYGLRTLLNGTLLPAPHIGRRNSDALRAVRDAGFETGLHAYDHFRWQDHVLEMSEEEVRAEFTRAREEYLRVFGVPARTAGAAGWQASAASRRVYDAAGLLYASDTRGTTPYFPRIGAEVFRTLEIPSTLPTLDELLGRPEYPEERIPAHYVSLLRAEHLNVFTLHAEIEGMGKRQLFRSVLRAFVAHGARFVRLEDLAREILKTPAAIPVCDLAMASVDGRSGLVATQVVGYQEASGAGG